MTVCVLILNINCIYITGQRGIWYSNLNFAAYRDASRERVSLRKERRALTIPRIWVAAGSKQLLCKALTMWPRIWGGLDNNSLTAAQSTLLPSTEFYRTKYDISSRRLYVSLRISTYWLLPWWCPHGTTKTAHLLEIGVTCLSLNILKRLLPLVFCVNNQCLQRNFYTTGYTTAVCVVQSKWQQEPTAPTAAWLIGCVGRAAAAAAAVGYTTTTSFFCPFCGTE